MSADHEFDDGGKGDADYCWAHVSVFGRGDCGRPRSEHPPAQVVEARRAVGGKMCPDCEGHGATFTCDGLPPMECDRCKGSGSLPVYADEVEPVPPADPARKPAPKLLSVLDDAIATAREKGRQAGAEEMREACAQAVYEMAKRAQADGAYDAAGHLEAAAITVATRPIPEPSR